MKIVNQDPTQKRDEDTPALEPEDYYFEGPNMVFTAAYLLKRGYCCGSGCRHCPYEDSLSNKESE